MLRHAAVIALLSIPALAAGQGPEQAPERLADVTLPPRLERVLRDYERAWQAGDEEALAELFVAAGLVPGRHGWLRGRQAIRDKYRDTSGDLRLRAVAFAAGETVAFIVGAYGYGDAAATDDEGSFVLALQRAAPGAPWLISADLDRGHEAPE